MPNFMHPVPEKAYWWEFVSRLFLCAMMIACTLILSCGRKALPTPVAAVAPPVVSDLISQVDGNMLKLTWSVPEWQPQNDDRLAGFRVYRSEEDRSDPVCDDCPRRFHLIAELPVEKTASDKVALYTEVMTEGFRYFYRVSCYTEDGVEGEKSEISDDYSLTGE